MSFDLTEVLDLSLLPTDLRLDCCDDGFGFEDVADVFQHGYCHVLALAIHDVTGWPVWTLKVTRGQGVGEDEHWLVEDPAGNLVDVYGANTPEGVLAYWHGLYETPVGEEDFRLQESSAEQILHLIEIGYAEEPEPVEALAAEAARILLEVEYGLSIAA